MNVSSTPFTKLYTTQSPYFIEKNLTDQYFSVGASKQEGDLDWNLEGLSEEHFQSDEETELSGREEPERQLPTTLKCILQLECSRVTSPQTLVKLECTNSRCGEKLCCEPCLNWYQSTNNRCPRCQQNIIHSLL